jgi:hypothetical protein
MKKKESEKRKKQEEHNREQKDEEEKEEEDEQENERKRKDSILLTSCTDWDRKLEDKYQSLPLFAFTRTVFRSLNHSGRDVVEHKKEVSELKSFPDCFMKTNDLDTFLSEKKTVLKKKQRKDVAEPASDNKDHHVHRVFQFRLPEFLSEDLWRRHNMSSQDIQFVLNSFDEKMLCRLILTYNRNITNSSTKIASDDDSQIRFVSSKVAMINKLIGVLKHHFPSKAPASTLWFSAIHDVPLPVHRISQESFQSLSKQTLFDLKQKEPKIVIWKNIYVIPILVEQEEQMILMNRIIPYSLYQKLYPNSRSYKRPCDIPNSFTTSEGLAFVLLNEAFFLCNDATFSSSSIAPRSNKNQTQVKRTKRVRKS